MMKMVYFGVTLFILHLFSQRQVLGEKSEKLTQHEYLDKLVHRQIYDKRQRPDPDDDGKKAVLVTVSIYILNMPTLTFTKQGGELTMEMYFRQSWLDPRLKFQDIESIYHIDEIIGGQDISDNIWVPDTFFVNEKNSEFKETYTKIKKDGSVLWSRKCTVTFTQHGQSFSEFPFDAQSFTLTLESYGSTAKDLRYHWDTSMNLKSGGGKALGINQAIDFYDFQLLGHHLQKSNTTLITEEGMIKAYLNLSVEFRLLRKSAYYFSILFTPLAIVVSICLLSFWIISEDRMFIIIFSNIFIIVYKIWFRSTQVPPVSDSMIACDYIDICLVSTLSCLFLHLAEILLIPKYKRNNDGRLNDNICMDEAQSSTFVGCRCFGIYIDQDRVNLVSRIILPISFIGMQIFFWVRVAAIPSSVDDLVLH